MFALLSGFSFLNPWILTALISLPAIWWLIRLTPPPPQTVQFPAIQFLLTLTNRQESSASIPWWLLLIRLLIAILIILGIAAPVYNLLPTTNGKGPVVLIVDNGWASGPGWEARENTINMLVEEFSRQQRLLYTVATASRKTEQQSSLLPLKPEDISKLDFALRPRAGEVNREIIKDLLPKFREIPDIEFVWLSDGVVTNEDPTQLSELMTSLSSIGPLTIYKDEAPLPPHVIGTPEISGGKISLPVHKPQISFNRQGVLIARSESGKIIARKPYNFGDDTKSHAIQLDLPLHIRNEIAQFEILNSKSAGSIFLLDNRWQRKTIGLVADENKGQGQSLLSEAHYLEKALIPYYDIRKNTLEVLLKEDISLIALGDAAAFSADISNSLKNWMKKGGILIRFSGPKLANSSSDISPVQLRIGNRNLDGTMSWTKPASLGPMAEDSPFARLEIDPKIQVLKQILANPSPDLREKTWAKLEDGTPLVTAARRGDGWVILFHTTATPNWSDLALSGLFVEMLREIGQLGSINNSQTLSAAQLLPLNLLDGFGQFEGNLKNSPPLLTSADEMTAPNAEQPAGYYGSTERKFAHNIGDYIDTYQEIDFSLMDGNLKNYRASSQQHLRPALLTLAFCLVILDILIAYFIQNGLKLLSKPTASALLLVAIGSLTVFTSPNPAQAEEDLSRLLDATLDTRLAYILTGDPLVDQMSEAGLYGLSKQLRRRTAIEAENPLPVDIENHTLIFFPMIYWPITPSFPAISDPAISKINRYLKGGGTVLFDTRDQYSSSIFGSDNSGSPESTRLRQILSRLDIPNLSIVPTDHVLTKSFYLMQSFPGRYRDGEIWIENTQGAYGNDGVASVLIGSNDWAAAWATDRKGQPLAAVLPGGERQREFAIRFGVNLVMYTLAGNYKADQVHIPAILERLGQ
ncbi:MAG: DUF4159 domain-containing protein [Sneathiella sp.]